MPGLARPDNSAVAKPEMTSTSCRVEVDGRVEGGSSLGLVEVPNRRLAMGADSDSELVSGAARALHDRPGCRIACDSEDSSRKLVGQGGGGLVDADLVDPR